jgi:DNA-binding MarR family transcriptional regulator
MSRPVSLELALEISDTCVCLHLQRAARAVGRCFDGALRPAGLTNGQFSLLMALNTTQPPSLGRVARLLGLDRTTLTAALKALRQRELVIISTDPADRRTRLLALTSAGQETLAAAVPVWREIHEALERQLPRIDADHLRAVLRSIATVG